MTAHRFCRKPSAAGVIAAAVCFALAGCSGQPSGGPTSSSPAGTPSPSATATATSTTTATSSPSSVTPLPDTDQTAAPQNGDRVISSAVRHDWGIPAGSGWQIPHQVQPPIAPPPEPGLPYLYSIGVGAHPTGESRPYDQISFRFKGAFPGYDVAYVPQLVQDGSGATIPMPGAAAILSIRFNPAQAHTEDGTASTIVSAPAPAVGYPAIGSYAKAGDFEGYVTYGVGVGRAGSTAQSEVRVIEVEKIEQGQHLYVVAVQVDRTPWAG